MIEHQLVHLALTQGTSTAQPSAPPTQPPASEGRAGTTQQAGDDSATPTGTPGAFGGDFMMILMLVIVAMIAFSFMSQRKQKKRQQDILSSVGKRSLVQTIGGIVGTVVDLQGDRVVLVVHEGSNSRLTIARSAIQQVLQAGDVDPEPEADADGDDEGN